ncbi:LOW QUALITY PROTEIN: hypothetical protein N5P37_005930, partial [Trichoderma harzianum]
MEWMGLMEYPHPFRFCQRALETDIAAGLAAHLDLVDDEKLYEMRRGIESTVPNIKTTDRLEIFPWMIPGSKLPTPSGPMVPPTPSW